LFEPGPIESKLITAEVCAHHLWFDQSSYATLGAKIKCNPAIKTQADRDALREAVRADVIDVIATDHAPHTLEEKGRGYFEAPSGLPLVQHSLLMLLEQYRQGLFTLPKIVEKAAHNPATLFGIVDRGFVREGYFADFVAVDLDAGTHVDKAQVRYKCGWSPFEGTDFHASVFLTVLNGVPVYRGGRPVDGPRQARALEFRARG
jgi:dihydroorotase